MPPGGTTRAHPVLGNPNMTNRGTDAHPPGGTTGGNHSPTSEAEEEQTQDHQGPPDKPTAKEEQTQNHQVPLHKPTPWGAAGGTRS